MATGEEPALFGLVMRGFNELVRPDCSEEGAREFTRAARSFVVERLAGHHVTVAERDGRLVGMIDVRGLSHVSLFFVESGERGHGVGRALLRSAIERCTSAGATSQAMTVNSSTWAVAVYKRLGFAATGPVSELNGIRFVPMIKLEDV